MYIWHTQCIYDIRSVYITPNIDIILLLLMWKVKMYAINIFPAPHKHFKAWWNQKRVLSKEKQRRPRWFLHQPACHVNKSSKKSSRPPPCLPLPHAPCPLGTAQRTTVRLGMALKEELNWIPGQDPEPQDIWQCEISHIPVMDLM